MNIRGKPSSRILEYFANPANQNRVITLSEVARATDHPADRVQTTIALLLKKKLIPYIEVRMRGQAWIVNTNAEAKKLVTEPASEPAKKKTRPEARSVTQVTAKAPLGDPQLVTFLEIGQMVDGDIPGLAGALGAKMYRRVVRDQTTGQLYKLVEL